jgi:hypothetical protein
MTHGGSRLVGECSARTLRQVYSLSDEPTVGFPVFVTGIGQETGQADAQHSGRQPGAGRLGVRRLHRADCLSGRERPLSTVFGRCAVYRTVSFSRAFLSPHPYLAEGLRHGPCLLRHVHVALAVPP